MNEGGPNPELALGKKIQAARVKAGMTQQALCHKADLSYSTLAKIERGAIKSPSIFTMQAIAQAVGTSIDDLVGAISYIKAPKERSKSKSGVSFVYFDVNGCMVRFYHRAFGTLAEEFNVSVDQIESVFWRYNDDVCKGEMSLVDFNKKLAEILHTDSIKWQDYYIAAAEPVPGVDDLTKWLKEYYGIGLLTNIMPGMLDGLTTSHKLPEIRFDAIVDSSVVKSIKPEEEIYRVAIENASTPTNEILLVDDTRANLVAAEKAGWHVIWFDYARPEESIESIKTAMMPTSS
jgi:FMN phosphatase YigB (HAD superfamily)/lambda repressor-like predicted transcriptional regulator